MSITDKLKLELFIREQAEQHGEDFYAELFRILERIENENSDLNVNRTESFDCRGKPNAVRVRWR